MTLNIDVNNQFEQKYQQSCLNKKMINLNKIIISHFEQKRHFENKFEQAIWTGIRTIHLILKMKNHFEQSFELSIWTKLWTLILSKIKNLNKYINNQFGQKYQQLNKKNIKYQFEQKYQQSTLNKKINE